LDEASVFLMKLCFLIARGVIGCMTGGLNTDGKYKGPKVTKQGYEVCFGVNFLGHFVLTMLLLPTMKATGQPARIVNVSSVTTWFASTKFQNYYSACSKTPPPSRQQPCPLLRMLASASYVGQPPASLALLSRLHHGLHLQPPCTISWRTLRISGKPSRRSFFS
jgi:hypothetical protein